MSVVRPSVSLVLILLLLCGGIFFHFAAAETAAPAVEEYQLAKPEDLAVKTYADHVCIIAVKLDAPLVRLPETVDGLPVTEVSLNLKTDPKNQTRAFYLPASVTGPVLFSGGNLERVEVDPQNPAYVSVDGRLYTKDLTALAFAYVAPGTAFAIPEGTLHVLDYAIQLSDDADLAGVSAVEIPASLQTFGCNPSLYCDYIVAEGNAQFTTLNGMLLSQDGRTLYTVNPSCFEAVTAQDGTQSLSKTMTIPDGIEVLTAAVFDTAVETLVVPASVTAMDIAAAREGGFVLISYEVADNNETFCSVDGVLYSEDLTTLVSVPKYKSFDAQTTLPEGLTTVAARAVRLIPTATQQNVLVFPETLLSIEAEAFYGMGYSSDKLVLDLPASVTQIGENAFTGALTVECPAGSAVAQAVQSYQNANEKSRLVLHVK